MRDEIHAAIPHRDPFLFVDRIVERGEGRLVTEWTVPADADFLRGHYPGRPLVPGVLICESAFQAGAILCAGDERDTTPAGAVPVLTRIGDARFKRMVGPGDTLRCEVTLDERVGPARYLTAKLSCGGKSVLRVQFVVAVTAAEAPASGGA
jgi:3-hydroxyacyl-[acyl-carrier-protein] dehydratase